MQQYVRLEDDQKYKEEVDKEMGIQYDIEHGHYADAAADAYDLAKTRPRNQKEQEIAVDLLTGKHDEAKAKMKELEKERAQEDEKMILSTRVSLSARRL
jgi:hypothetical protein